MNTNNMNCPLPEDLLAVMIDNEGNPDEINAIHKHVGHCDRCSAVLSQYAETGELVKEYKLKPVHLSPGFTVGVMDAVAGADSDVLIDDILGLSRKVVTVFTFFAVILLGIMLFPGEAAIDVYTVEGFPIENGAESEVLIKDELTDDDVISLALTQR